MQGRGVKSFVDDLVLGRGVVLSRAATSLRSIETKPFDYGFVRFRRAHPLLSLGRSRCSLVCAVSLVGGLLLSLPLSLSLSAASLGT